MTQKDSGMIAASSMYPSANSVAGGQAGGSLSQVDVTRAGKRRRGPRHRHGLARVASTRANEPALQRLALTLWDAAHTGKLNDHAPTTVLRQTAEYSSQLLLDLVLSAPENLDWVGPSSYGILGSLKLARNVNAHDWFAQNRGERCFQHRPDGVEWTF